MAQIQHIPVAILFVLNWAIIYVIIIEYRYLTVPTMYACHPLQRCMYHWCSDLCLGLRTILVLLVAKMNSLTELFIPNLYLSITDPGSKAPDPGSGSARKDYVFLTPKNVAMLA